MTNKYIRVRPVAPQITELVEKHARNPESLLEMLNSLQAQDGKLDSSLITELGGALNIPPATAYGIASFYSMLNLKEPVKNVIRMCDGPVCWLCGAGEAQQAVNEVIKEHSDWKIERTSCLGLCDRAPALLVNQQQSGP